MANPIIHINRKYHIPLNSILCIKQKKRGVYVQFIDPKSKMTLYAIYKGDLGSILTIVNNALLMRGDSPMLVIKE